MRARWSKKQGGAAARASISSCGIDSLRPDQRLLQVADRVIDRRAGATGREGPPEEKITYFEPTLDLIQAGQGADGGIWSKVFLETPQGLIRY